MSDKQPDKAKWLADAAEKIRRCNERADAAQSEAFDAHRAAGRELIRVKDGLKHGEFLPWVKANLEALGLPDVRRAQEQMQAAQLPDEDARLVAHLALGSALREWRKARPVAAPDAPVLAPRAFTMIDIGTPVAPVRPAYTLPRLTDLAAPSASAPTVISTFTGAGGSCLGFRMAGYRTLAAVERYSAARATYQANFPGVPVLAADVRSVTGARLLEAAGVERGEVDVLEGSPPCAAYSSAASSRKGPTDKPGRYSDGKQRTDDLLPHMARLVGEVQPRVFVIENVPELARRHMAVLREFVGLLEGHGYDVAVARLDAEWLGVPQRRHRLVVLGLRADLVDRDSGVTAAACVPSPLPWRYTLADALAVAPSPTTTEKRKLSITKNAIGKEWKKLTPGGQSPVYRITRPRLDAPCPTITATTASSIGAAGVTHPTECRKMSPRELLAVSGFPSDFKLTGTIEQQGERVGRAVPPPMMRAVADRITWVLARVVSKAELSVGWSA